MVVDADMLFRVLSVLVSAGAFLFTWAQAKNKAGADALRDLEAKVAAVRAETDNKIAQLRTDVAATSQRCSELEGELKHMPDKDTVHKIELAMKNIEAQVAAQAETLRGYADALQRNTTTMQRLEEFLMNARAGSPAAVAARRK